MIKKGFIFDLDGVIVDTAKYHFLAWRDLANSIGFNFTLEQNEQLKGVSRVKSLEKILAWGNVQISDKKFQELMDEKNEDYLQYINKMDQSEILPDVPRILDYLMHNNQPIALGSASKNARTILEQVNLLHKFDAIVDGTNVSKAKPDPEVFLIAAELIKVKPKYCIVFEDSLAGIEAANAANMISIGIGHKDILDQANYNFNDFTELDTKFLNKLIKN